MLDIGCSHARLPEQCAEPVARTRRLRDDQHGTGGFRRDALANGVEQVHVRSPPGVGEILHEAPARIDHRRSAVRRAERGEFRGRPGLEDFRSEEHTSELQSLMRISYAVFCLKKKTRNIYTTSPVWCSR